MRVNVRQVESCKGRDRGGYGGGEAAADRSSTRGIAWPRLSMILARSQADIIEGIPSILRDIASKYNVMVLGRLTGHQPLEVYEQVTKGMRTTVHTRQQA